MLPYSSKKQHVGGGVQHKILFVFGIILALSCQPQGQLERHIHAPHLSFLADPKPGFQKHLNAENRAHTQDQAGIPSSCQIENRDKTNLCITCMPDDFIVERCYRFQGQLDILSSCAYSQEHLKCLQRDPPLAINLNFKRSLEKELIEHINTWQESLSSIALNQFDEPQKIEFTKATHWTTQLLLELIKLHGVEPWAEENLLV
ncbi:MAG: hypothetical protein NTX25_05215, partial [Proteobacteria bacterium]|nr:hypothetical protein [Pseudomonadota bacterium]